jgi:hypothetical protein
MISNKVAMMSNNLQGEEKGTKKKYHSGPLIFFTYDKIPLKNFFSITKYIK